MPERSGIFDMIGPIMIGPSSSHTGGVVKIGLVAHQILGNIPETVSITFYNSFARTYEGHGSDRAIMGGLMNFKPDNEKIKEALQIAKDKKINFTFKAIPSASIFHPNTIKIEAEYKKKICSIIGESRGGGVIRIREVNGFDANFSASMFTLIIEAEDVKGSVSFITSILAHDDSNIATMTVSRDQKSGNACLILELDSSLSTLSIQYLKSLNWVKNVIEISEI